MQNILSDINYDSNNKQITAIISLFGICNLHCKFCNQRHNKNYPQNISGDFFQNCIPLLWKKLHMQFWKKRITKINFVFQGGQIFFDILNISLYQKLVFFKNQINTIFKNIDYKITFISNGIFLNRDNVLNVLNMLNAKIIFSYDPVDRFLIKQQKKTFFDTLNYFYKQKKIDSINILLNKKTIYSYINDDSEIKKLCKKYNTTVNLKYYIPNENESIYNINSNDIYNFYSFALKSDWKSICPEILEIIKAINNIKLNIKLVKRHCTCSNTYRINQVTNEYSNNCMTCNINNSDINLEKYDQNQGKNIILNGLYKNNCNVCSYKYNCIMPCWNVILSKHYNVQQICPFKRVIQENLNA